MDNKMSKVPEHTIGIDLGDKYTYFCVLDNSGSKIEEGRIVTSKEAFEHKFTRMEPARMVIETGTHSRWVQQIVAEANHEVIGPNPRKLRMIYQNDTKNDRLDAEQPGSGQFGGETETIHVCGTAQKGIRHGGASLPIPYADSMLANVERQEKKGQVLFPLPVPALSRSLPSTRHVYSE